MLVSFSWQGYLDFSLFTLHFSLQQLTWYRLNYLTTDYLTTSESRVNYLIPSPRKKRADQHPCQSAPTILNCQLSIINFELSFVTTIARARITRCHATVTAAALVFVIVNVIVTACGISARRRHRNHASANAPHAAPGVQIHRLSINPAVAVP